MPQDRSTRKEHTKADNAYLRCLRGQITAPTSGKERVAFQMIMVLFMVSCMVTFNWAIRQTDISLGAFSGVLHEYPLTFCIALIMRTFVANPLVDRIVPHVPSSLSGIRRSLFMTVVNVGIMASIMTFFGTLISFGFDGFTWMEFVSSIPVSVPASIMVNFLAVGPLVKILYTQAVRPRLDTLNAKRSSARKPVTSPTHTFISGSGK